MSWKASKLTRHKQKLFAKYKDSEHSAYKSVAKEVKRELRRSRIKFEKQLANNIKDDAKSFYAYARSKSKSASKIGSLTDDDGNDISTEQGIAEEFNNFFTTVFTVENISSAPVTQQ